MFSQDIRQYAQTVNITPTISVPSPVCGGSTNNICPTATPTPGGVVTVMPTVPDASPIPTGITPPAPTTDPCENAVVSVASHKNKHKNKGNGAVRGITNSILELFINFLNFILKLLGGQPIVLPTNPGTPQPTTAPQPTVDPGQPVPTNNPTLQPTQQPAPTEEPGQPMPTTNPCQPTAAPTAVQPTQTQPTAALTPTQSAPTLLPSLTSVLLPTSSPTARTCTNPVFTTSDTNGGWSNGGYYVHNNMWNAAEGGPETLYACAYNNWYVESTQPNTTSVKTYPNVHLDINNLNGAPWSNYKTITSTFAGQGPRVGIYNVAYDIWLNGVGWGNGTTEVMIWTENFNQRPLGSVKAQLTSGGMTYDAWHYNSGGANVVSFVAKTTMLSGNVNLKEMIDWAISKGMIPQNPTVNQIGYGVEICSTNNTKQRFTFTDFSVTIN